jgi:aldehyde:ferredoxin oxidoreductase
MKKILRINLAKKEFSLSALPELYLNLGGRGLTSRLIAEEVPPGCDPLGDDNKLVFAAGVLAGTALPNSGRLSIGAKSPLTGTIKESNAGGSAAQKMARLGIQAIVLEGRAEEPLAIRIDKEGVTFASANNLNLLGNLACIAHCRQHYGDGAAVISIGPAGEMLLKASAISVSSPDFQPRMAGRGGLAAVMGAKRVKMVVIDDSEGAPVPIKEQALFKASLKSFSEGLLAHPLIGGLKLFGTPILVGMINEMGALPTKNFSQGQFAAADKISGESLAELIKSRPNGETAHRCMNGCVISCSNVVTDREGNTVVSGLEYETLALIGANCMISDLDLIARMNAACNDIGVDTMDIGGAIAVAMEAGILPWGDGVQALELVEAIGKGTETGKILGNGCRYAAEKFGIKRIPVVKGQCLAGYDPRVLKGTGVTYATSTMGADHTCGNALPSPANPAYNPSAATGQGPVSQFLQRYFAAIDSLGLCLFAALPPLDMPELQKHLIDCVSAVLDESLDDQYLLRLGAMVLEEEQKFNTAAGFGREHDRLPEFFCKEPLLPGGNTFDVPEEELDMVHK